MHDEITDPIRLTKHTILRYLAKYPKIWYQSRKYQWLVLRNSSLSSEINYSEQKLYSCSIQNELAMDHNSCTGVSMGHNSNTGVSRKTLGSVGRQHLCYTDPPILHNNGIVNNWLVNIWSVNMCEYWK